MVTILSSFQVTTPPRAATGALYANAVDGAFATIYGEANLTHFEVWAYPRESVRSLCGRSYRFI